MKNSETFYFTFGSGQVNENCYCIINAVNWDEARKLMFDMYGNKWAFQYIEKDWFDENGISQAEKYGLKLIA